MLLLVPTAREARALFDGGRAPRAEDPETLALGGRAVRAAVCGFGPAAAGALAALALVRERPDRCLLVGVAGSYDLARLPVGALLAPARVASADLGAGPADAVRAPAALGFEQAPAAAGRAAVGDALDLDPPPGPASPPGALLLTVARTSASEAEARARARTHPGALAEDMEGFAVAVAAQRLAVPLGVVRAVSNAAGETDRARWDVDGALAALRAWLLTAAV
jgi:futalosine hydrolase